MPEIVIIPAGHIINPSPKHPLPIGSLIIGGNGHSEGKYTQRPWKVEAYRARGSEDKIASPANIVENPDSLQGYWIRDERGGLIWMEKKFVCSVVPEPPKPVDVRKDRFEIILDGL